jgi:hypothetical protein
VIAGFQDDRGGTRAMTLQVKSATAADIHLAEEFLLARARRRRAERCRDIRLREATVPDGGAAECNQNSKS